MLLRRRFKALLFDYLFILVYLLILFITTLGFYFLVFKKIPELTHNQSQIIAFLTTVLPITIFFTIFEAKYPYAALGKRRLKLYIEYNNNPVLGSIIRNILKFLPWQIAHISVIRGIYIGFDNLFVLITYILSLGLLILYILLVIIRKDHRHLPDLISKSTIKIKK